MPPAVSLWQNDRSMLLPGIFLMQIRLSSGWMGQFEYQLPDFKVLLSFLIINFISNGVFLKIIYKPACSECDWLSHTYSLWSPWGPNNWYYLSCGHKIISCRTKDLLVKKEHTHLVKVPFFSPRVRFGQGASLCPSRLNAIQLWP